MQTNQQLSLLLICLTFSEAFYQSVGQPVDDPDSLIHVYLSSHNSKQHGHRHTRECQHLRYGNVTNSKIRAHGLKKQLKGKHEPVAEIYHAIIPIGPYFNQRDNQVHLTVVNNPARTVSVLEPRSFGGCETHTTSTVMETAKQKHCLVAVNAGFFDTHNGSCLGNVISDGRLVLDSEGVQNAQFGITKDGNLFFGYLSEIDLIAEQFKQLVGGVIWIIRDGIKYINESINIECEDTQETGTLQRFATVTSARTAVGHDIDGRLLIMQVDGKTDHNGMTLDEFADVLLKHGFVNAINLDGGGSSTFVVNGTLVNYPTDTCPDDPRFNCARNVSTVICVHDMECSPPDCSGHGMCKGGICLCDTNWAGPSCDHLSCLDDCSIHGTCTNDGCSCDDGWKGDNCNTSCPTGFYGKSCQQKCSCSTGSTGTCDPVTGFCNCKPGYTGTLCEKECEVGFYGYSCTSVCLCPDGCPCHHITGSCNFTHLDHHYMQVGVCYARQEIQKQNLVPDRSEEFRSWTTGLICVSIFGAISFIVNMFLLRQLFITKKKVKHKGQPGKKSKTSKNRFNFSNDTSEGGMSSFSDYPMQTTSFSKIAKNMHDKSELNDD